MEFKKLITGSIVAASLFGISLGSSSLNAKADVTRNSSINNPNQLTPKKGSSDSNGHYSGNNSDQKNANITVDNGLLNLDNVPDLNFGNQSVSQYSTQLGLQNNQNNQSNILQVTDNRNPDNANDKGPWTVSASLGPVFYKTDGGNNIESTDGDWSINLNKTGVNNDENHPFNTQQTSLPANGGTKNIMSTSDGSSNGQGVNTIHYNNDSNDASLTIPYNVKRGSYSAQVTWNLGVNVNANNANTTTPSKPNQ